MNMGLFGLSMPSLERIEGLLLGLPTGWQSLKTMEPFGWLSAPEIEGAALFPQKAKPGVVFLGFGEFSARDTVLHGSC